MTHQGFVHAFLRAGLNSWIVGLSAWAEGTQAALFSVHQALEITGYYRLSCVTLDCTRFLDAFSLANRLFVPVVQADFEVVADFYEHNRGAGGVEHSGHK